MTGSSFRLLNKGISIKSLDSLTALAPEKGILRLFQEIS